MAVSKRVPANPAQSRLLSCRDQPVFLNSAWPIRPSRFRVRENPSLRIAERSELLFVFPKLLRQQSVERHPSLGGLCLEFTLLPVNVGLPHCQLQTFPVDVLPLQSEDFAYPQSQTHRHNAHRSKWLGNMFKQFPKFFYGKCLRLPLPFLTVLDADQAHGVVLIRNQLPSHGRIKKDTDQVFEVRLAFRCQGELLEPILNEQRFDLR